MTYQTLGLTWRGIEFTLAFHPLYFKSANMAHIEIYCDEPLPITETGYRSIFISASDVTDIKVAAALVRNELDGIAQRTGWQQEWQLSLF